MIRKLKKIHIAEPGRINKWKRQREVSKLKEARQTDDRDKDEKGKDRKKNAVCSQTVWRTNTLAKAS